MYVIYPLGDGDVAELSLHARLVHASINLPLRVILVQLVEDALDRVLALAASISIADLLISPIASMLRSCVYLA